MPLADLLLNGGVTVRVVGPGVFVTVPVKESMRGAIDGVFDAKLLPQRCVQVFLGGDRLRLGALVLLNDGLGYELTWRGRLGLVSRRNYAALPQRGLLGLL